MKAKEWQTKRETQRILDKARQISLSDSDSTDSEEDEVIFTNAATAQGEAEEAITPTKTDWSESLEEPAWVAPLKGVPLMQYTNLHWTGCYDRAC